MIEFDQEPPEELPENQSLFEYAFGALKRFKMAVLEDRAKNVFALEFFEHGYSRPAVSETVFSLEELKQEFTVSIFESGFLVPTSEVADLSEETLKNAGPCRSLATPVFATDLFYALRGPDAITWMDAIVLFQCVQKLLPFLHFETDLVKNQQQTQRLHLFAQQKRLSL